MEEDLPRMIREELTHQAANMNATEIEQLAKFLSAQEVEFGEIGITAAVVGYLTAKGRL